jgi:three-Cys-motif partner protein
MAEHDFGGPWTEIKLDAVEYYLKCYADALTSARFDLWYIDAFAGTGDRTERRQKGGLFEGAPLHVVTETLSGSARRALKIVPPFQHFIFNEMNDERRSALEALKGQHPERDIKVLPGDANVVIKEIFSVQPWLSKARSKARGVVFLDPYALQVNWETLVFLAATEAVDVWYLFPIRDVTRQLATKKSGIGPKQPRLDKVLSPDWIELYSLPSSQRDWVQDDMFGERVLPEEEERNATQKQIEAWFQKKLEAVFPFASEPLPLLTGGSRQAFSLFLCVANRSDRAIKLAKHFHRYVMKNFAPEASRRRSGR